MAEREVAASSRFRAEVALAALRGDAPLERLAQEYGVEPQTIDAWRRTLEEGAELVFDRLPEFADDPQGQIDALYREIGRLKVERDHFASRAGADTDTGYPPEDPNIPDDLIPQD